jgi:hypothetical protein
MADEDENVRMPTDNRDYVSGNSDNDDDDIGRGENENMDDWGEDESDEEVNNDDDDEEEEEKEEVHDEIVNKFIGTFHNGDYDQEFDDALSSDRSIAQPTTRATQASYIKPDNWIERNRIGLERVKEQLEDCINCVSRDEISTFVCHTIVILINCWITKNLLFGTNPS